MILLRGGPLAGCLLFMAAATCLSADFFSFNAGALRLTIDRVFWGVVMLLYLIWRQRGWTDPKPLQAADKAALALVAYLAVRTLLTDPHGTGLTPVVNLVLWYVMPLGIYWVVRQSRIDRPQNTMVFTCLTLFGIYLAVTVIAERFEAYWLVYPRYIVTSMTEKTAEFVGAAAVPCCSPSSPASSSRPVSSAVLMFWPRLGRWGRCGVALAAAVFALAFYSTMTRSVWMGAGLGLVVIVGLSMPSKLACVPVLGAAVLLAGAIAAANWEQFVAFKRDKNLTARETADSVALRPVMARVAWLMVLDRPLWGCGFGQYLPEHENYLADRSTELVLEKSRPYCAAQPAVGHRHRDGPGRAGALPGPADALGPRRLAAVARCRGAALGPAAGAVLSRRVVGLPGQRHVPSHRLDPHVEHPLVFRRRDERGQ